MPVLSPPRTLVLTAACFLTALAASGCEAGAGTAEPATAASDGVQATAPQQPEKPARPILTLDTPKDAFPLVWVRVHKHVKLRREPGGEVLDRVGRHTQFGSTSVFGVVRRSGNWAAVSTPILPNGQLAWIRLNSDHLRGGWTKTSIVVDLSERRAQMLQGGVAKHSFAVTVGAPGSETPTGRFAVTDTFRGDLNPVYGCCALALSATQPHLPSGWLGGRRIAIHGTYGALGVAASHGCVRAADADVSELVDHVSLGTPVFIRE